MIITCVLAVLCGIFLGTAIHLYLVNFALNERLEKQTELMGEMSAVVETYIDELKASIKSNGEKIEAKGSGVEKA